jgi:hypothetical protein
MMSHSAFRWAAKLEFRPVPIKPDGGGERVVE